MKNYNTCHFMEYHIFSDHLENIGIKDTLQVINTINAYSYVMADGDLSFKKALQNSDILVPDGFPVVISAWFLNKIKIKKIAGADVFYHFCNRMNHSAGKCFFLGSSPSTLSLITNKLGIEFPNIRVSSYSPPYKTLFNSEDNKIMLEKIKDFAPDVLFVGMTAPKQEKWVEQFRNEISAKIACSIGAVFDFYAGTTKRPSNFWIQLNLEWFIRLLREPRRLWKRYLIYSPLFFVYILKNKMNAIRKKQ